MRRKLMITLLTMTMAASLFVGCGTSETVETPVVEETVEEPEVVEQVEENTTIETEETNESETVAKPKASTHYKEWKEKQEEVETPVETKTEVAESKEETTKKETEKKEDTTTTASTSTTNTNTNTPAPTPEPTPAASTPSNNNTTTPVAETPAAPAAPTGWNCSTQGHKMSSTVISMIGHTIEQGTGQYEQVLVNVIPGEPIYDELGTVIGLGPETPVYETREVTTPVLVHTATLQDTCSVCGYSTTRTVTE